MKVNINDRVKVTDLRTGTVHRGVVVGIEGAKYLVRYDSGVTVRVGEGFVSKA
jgi:hypothetical protein